MKDQIAIHWSMSARLTTIAMSAGLLEIDGKGVELNRRAALRQGDAAIDQGVFVEQLAGDAR